MQFWQKRFLNLNNTASSFLCIITNNQIFVLGILYNNCNGGVHSLHLNWSTTSDTCACVRLSIPCLSGQVRNHQLSYFFKPEWFNDAHPGDKKRFYEAKESPTGWCVSSLTGQQHIIALTVIKLNCARFDSTRRIFSGYTICLMITSHV
jgi:hypothetical protein